MNHVPTALRVHAASLSEALTGAQAQTQPGVWKAHLQLHLQLSRPMPRALNATVSVECLQAHLLGTSTLHINLMHLGSTDRVEHAEGKILVEKTKGCAKGA